MAQDAALWITLGAFFLPFSVYFGSVSCWPCWTGRSSLGLPGPW